MSTLKALIYRPIVQSILIVLTGIIVYFNTLNAPFIWDDKFLILDNRNIRDLSNFTDVSGTRYLTFLSFAVNYRIGGYEVTGYHIFNIIVHLLNALLVYSFVLDIFRTPFFRGGAKSGKSHLMALFSGLIFVSHPVYTQAVTNINQRSILLAAFFYLLSIISFMRARLNYKTFFSVRHLPYYVLSLISAVLAMKCKEISFTLPLIIVLCERYFFAGQWSLRRALAYVMPVLLALLIIPLSRPQSDVFQVSGQGVFKIMGNNVISGLDAAILSNIPRKDYILTEFRVFVTYLRLFFFPINLNLDYDYPIFGSLLDPEVFLSFLSVFLTSGLSVYLYYLSRLTSHALRLISFGILWFFTALSVEAFAVVLNYPIFEYRIYHPSIGLILILVGVAAHVIIQTQFYRRTLIGGAVILVIVLSTATYVRNEKYKDEPGLWNDVIKKSPDSRIAHDSLGHTYIKKGQLDRAIEEFRAILKTNRNFAPAYSNLGTIYYNQGMIAEAITEYKKALRIQPDYIEAHSNLAVVYTNQGMVKEAVEEYRNIVNITPNDSEAHNRLAHVYYREGNLNAALNEYNAALTLNPGSAELHNNIGNVYMGMELFDRAISHYQAITRLNPEFVEAHHNLGIAYSRKGLTDKANREFQEALKLDPELIREYKDILSIKGK